MEAAFAPVGKCMAMKVAPTQVTSYNISSEGNNTFDYKVTWIVG